LTAWWDLPGQSNDAPKSRPHGSSVYESRFTDGPYRPVERWVTVASQDPAGGALRWLPDWERRAQGWTPLDERGQI
jgi:hypothetical protein